MIIFKKSIVLFIILLLCNIILNAQLVNYDWINQIDCDHLLFTDSCIDSEGNRYVTGKYSSEVDFLGTALKAKGSGWDTFIARMKPDGSLDWVISDGKKGINDESLDIAVDKWGNAFLLFSTSKGSDTKKYAYGKLSADGQWLWKKKLGSGVEAMHIATDLDGNVYICGSFDKKLKFGSNKFKTTNKGIADYFVVKLNSEAKFEWLTQIKSKGSGKIIMNQLQADNAGNVYFCGRYNGQFEIGDRYLYGGKKSYNREALIVKLDAEGKISWKKTGSNEMVLGTGFEMVQKGSSEFVAMMIDSDQNVYLAGEAKGTAKFGEYNDYSVNHPHAKNVFVIKYDKYGKFVWVNQVINATKSYSTVNDISLDESGKLFLIGRSISDTIFFGEYMLLNEDDDFFIACLDVSGQWIGAIRNENSFVDEAKSIEYFDGSIFINVTLTGSEITGKAGSGKYCRIGDQTLSVKQDRCQIVAKLNKNEFLKAAEDNLKPEDVAIPVFQEKKIEYENLSDEIDFLKDPAPDIVDVKLPLRTAALQLLKGLEEDGYEKIVFKKGYVGRDGGLSSGELTFEWGTRYLSCLVLEKKYEKINPYIKAVFNNGEEYTPKSENKMTVDDIPGYMITGMFFDGYSKEEKYMPGEIVGWSGLPHDMKEGYIIVVKMKK